ncbi:hypothetical protein GQ53DRAFT_128073 [Thozetella sp. PMI_491]|nr:hypothetical protein GQ53DRAFT_128073 [Thozetella sp. PMI_491]
MDDGKPNHTCLRAQCGICGRPLQTGASFVPLTGSDQAAGSASPLDRAVFPQRNSVHPASTSISINGRLFCWHPNCWRCGTAPEAVGVHSDCLHLFQEECQAEDALGRLWMAVVSRSPWRGAPNLHLDRDGNLAPELVYEKADQYGIPSLKSLPPELIQMVRDYSESGTFWRYISVVNLGRELLATIASRAPSPVSSIPLCDIKAWTRGGEPELLQSPERPPVMRLTFDSRGIRQVERLPSRPSYRHWRSENMAFAVHEESDLEGIIGQFKDGVLRLELPESIRGLHIWDMPSPPRISDCEFCGHLAQSMRFRTVDLRDATGLTFFFALNKVYAVHAHTPATPHATSTFERLAKRRQADVTWVYLPVPKGEEIMAIGVRSRQLEGRSTTQKPCILVRMKLAGDVALGPCYREDYRDTVLSQANPRLFIYNTVDLGPATFFGTYSPEPSNDSSFPPFQRPPLEPGPLSRANLGVAPLKDVIRIRIFYRKDTGFCRGIWFDYKNGARRAVGSCWLGVHPSKTFLNPTRICYCPATYHRMRPTVVCQAVRVESGSDSIHRHQDPWVCSALHGSLEFWFSEIETAMRFVEDVDAPPSASNSSP